MSGAGGGGGNKDDSQEDRYKCIWGLGLNSLEKCSIVFHGVHIIYFSVGMGNTVFRVKQPSLRYLYPLMCLLFLFFHTCLFGILLSFQLVALYRHLPFVLLAYQVHSPCC